MHPDLHPELRSTLARGDHAERLARAATLRERERRTAERTRLRAAGVGAPTGTADGTLDDEALARFLAEHAGAAATSGRHLAGTAGR